MAELSAIDRLVARARVGMDRVLPEDLPAEVAAGALVVDIRTLEQRRRDGDLPGADVSDRTHLERSLDPTSTHHIPETAPVRRIVLVCNEGYSSSLAARTLRDLGLTRATDLVGGFQRWKHSTTPPGP